jgi:hypothetical protein
LARVVGSQFEQKLGALLIRNAALSKSTGQSRLTSSSWLSEQDDAIRKFVSFHTTSAKVFRPVRNLSGFTHIVERMSEKQAQVSASLNVVQTQRHDSSKFVDARLVSVGAFHPLLSCGRLEYSQRGLGHRLIEHREERPARPRSWSRRTSRT